MNKKLSTKITAIVAAISVMSTSALLCGCNKDKYYNYIVDYMNDIPSGCREYQLVDGDIQDIDGKYVGSINEVSTTILCKDTEIIVSAKRKGNFEWELIIDEDIITVNKIFMAEKSKEYVAVTEMWFRYEDDMENYRDTYYCNIVTIFDNNIFILAHGYGTVSMIGSQLYGLKPITLYKYDIEKEEVQYVDYYVDKVDTSLPVRIIKIE